MRTFNQFNNNLGQNEFMNVYKMLNSEMNKWRKEQDVAITKEKISTSREVNYSKLANIFNPEIGRNKNKYRGLILSVQGGLGTAIVKMFYNNFDIKRDNVCYGISNFLNGNFRNINLNQYDGVRMLKNFLDSLLIVAENGMLSENLLKYFMTIVNNVPGEVHGMLVKIIQAANSKKERELKNLFMRLKFEEKDAEMLAEKFAEKSHSYIEIPMHNKFIREYGSGEGLKDILSLIYSLQLDDNSEETVFVIGSILFTTLDNEGMNKMVRIIMNENIERRKALPNENKITFDVITDVALTWMNDSLNSNDLRKVINILTQNGKNARVRINDINGFKYNRVKDMINRIRENYQKIRNNMNNMNWNF